MVPRASSRPLWPLLRLATLALAGFARGQCTTQWLPGLPFAGVQPGVFAITEWDPDGAGPLPAVIVFGGSFTAAGNVLANRIAAFDPATGTWSTFGSGMNNHVRALAVLPNGELVAAGDFTVAGGLAANLIARWNGVAWSPLASGLTGSNSTVRALAVLPGGELVAAGYFDNAGGVSANRIASWDGATWSPLGTGLGGFTHSLLVLPNGELVAGGEFATAGGAPASRIARWNGTAWSALGAGFTSYVYAMTTLPNGELVAGGAFTHSGNTVVNRIARWNGTSWSPFGGGVPGWWVQGLCTLPNGTLVAAGESIEQWTGANWVGLSSGGVDGVVYAIARLANGTVIAAGTLETIGGVALDGVAAWDGTAWSQLGPPIAHPRSITGAASLANGDLVAGGQFWGGNPFAHRVCSWDGVSFSQLGGDFDNQIARLANAADGSIIACGAFTNIGGVPADRIVRWDGAAWQPLGSGVSSIGINGVGVLLPLPNGDLVAAGSVATAGGQVARVARWDGSAWTAVGSDLNGGIFALTTAANGDIVAGGAIVMGTTFRRVVQWNGAAWVPLGALNDTVNALASLPNGEIVAGGAFTSAGGVALHRVARWDGVAWQPLGAGVGGSSVVRVRSLAVLPDGDLVACGDFTTAGGLPAWQVARWNGATWSPMATSGSGSAYSLALMADGDLVVTNVQRMDDAISLGFARLTTTCPASAIATTAGCVGSAGLNVLTPTTLPWTGSTFHAQATGLPANAIALDVLGLSTAVVPLSQILPQGVASCLLHVSPDAVGLLLPAGGAVATQLPIPSTAALAGAVVHDQVLALELDAGGAIVAFTGTNRLTLTIGTF